MIVLFIHVAPVYAVGVVEWQHFTPDTMTHDASARYWDDPPGFEGWVYYARAWMDTYYEQNTGLAWQLTKAYSYKACWHATFNGEKIRIGYFKGLKFTPPSNRDNMPGSVTRKMGVSIDDLSVDTIMQGKTSDSYAESFSSGGDSTIYEWESPDLLPGDHTLTLCPPMYSHYGGAGYMNFLYVSSYQIDDTPPSNPDVVEEANGGLNGVWNNLAVSPAFTWSGARDDLSGVLGYDTYFGVDPEGQVGNFIQDEGFSSFLPEGPLQDGVYSLRVRTRDKAENYAEWITLFSLFLDTVQPQVQVNPLPDGDNSWDRTDPIDITLDIQDELSGIAQAQYSLNSDAFQPMEYINQPLTSLTNLTLSLPDGTYGLHIDAQDVAGNEASADGTLRVDYTPPQLEVVSINWDNIGILVEGTIQDATSGIRQVQVRKDGEDWQEAEIYANGDRFIQHFADDGYGERSILVRAEDNAGNRTTLDERFIQRAQPVIPYEPQPYTPTVTETITPTPTATLPPQRETTRPPIATSTLTRPEQVATVLPALQALNQATPVQKPVVRCSPRTFWQFITLSGLAFALGLSAVIDERPRRLRQLTHTFRKFSHLRRNQ